MTLIALSDEDAAALKAKAAQRGMTIQSWIKMMAEEEPEVRHGASDSFPLQTAAKIFLDAMRQVPPEAFTNRPKDSAGVDINLYQE